MTDADNIDDRILAFLKQEEKPGQRRQANFSTIMDHLGLGEPTTFRNTNRLVDQALQRLRLRGHIRYIKGKRAGWVFLEKTEPHQDNPPATAAGDPPRGEP